VAERELNDLCELYELATFEEDVDAILDITSDFELIKNKIEDLEVKSLFNGDLDGHDAVVEIHAGTGGTEAQWWAEQLMRMYLLWFKKRGFEAELLDTAFGDESGIKSATISISGHFPYGWVRTETGIHRLSRVSEFDSSGRRHTSFASVTSYPFINDEVEIEIAKSDVEVETFKSSGPGGQHVNKTDSAVRMKHKPTGLVVCSQSERSQMQNRKNALRLLKSKLYGLENKLRLDKKSDEHKEKSEISWGQQVRSYIFHPYRLVVDHRTLNKYGNLNEILGGNLDEVVKNYLLSR
jgi:peptide chain release factor 2